MKTILLAKTAPVIGATLKGYRFNNGAFESVTTSTVVDRRWQPEINAWATTTVSGSIYFVIVNLS